jgi:hypothetical protein
MEFPMRRSFVVLAAVSSLFAAGAAFAHHGWGSYDASKRFTIRSQVEALRWQNPHVHLDLMHAFYAKLTFIALGLVNLIVLHARFGSAMRGEDLPASLVPYAAISLAHGF